MLSNTIISSNAVRLHRVIATCLETEFGRVSCHGLTKNGKNIALKAGPLIPYEIQGYRF